MSSTPSHEPHSRSGFGYLYAGIGLFLVLLILLLWRAGAGHAQATSVTYQPEVVATGRISIQQGFTLPLRVRGLVESSQSAQLSFDIGGILNALHADEGASVTKGQILATLNTARLAARQRELAASLDRAKANARLAELSMARVDELVNQQLESSQRQDEARAQLSAANAQVREMQAALAAITVERDKSQLRAPFDGQITARFLDEGATLTPGRAVFALTNNRHLQARFALPSQDHKRFTRGQTVQLTVADTAYTGTVTQVLAERRQQTRTVDMLVTLPAEAAVLPGDMAELNLSRTRAEQGAWVPVSALSNGLRGLWTVLVLSDRRNADKAHQVSARTVEVIYSDGARAFVRGALRDGDMFVRSGTHKISPGQWVITDSKTSNTHRAVSQ